MTTTNRISPLALADNAALDTARMTLVDQLVHWASLRIEERVFLPGQSNPVILKRNSNALFLLQRVRDEAHRFAITYHKKLRSKQTLYSALDKIPGVGGVRKRALLRTFGSIKRIQEANLEELLKVPSMNEKIAREIVNTLHTTPVENASDVRQQSGTEGPSSSP